jgi:hypothetical protein
MKPNIVTTWKEIKRRTGRDGIEFIQVRDLGKYGFYDDIVIAMGKYDIFPQVYVVSGGYYVMREEIFGVVVRNLLKNAMNIYQAVENKDASVAAVRAAMEDVVMDEEAVAKLASGEWTMDQVRERSAGIIAERKANEPATVEETV